MRTTSCCLIVCGLFIAGCQDGTPGPAGTSIEQGLTVISESQQDGLVGMYSEGDRVVFFETLTRPMSDEIIAHYNAHEIPLTRPTFSWRWTDEEGRAIAQDGEWDELPDYADPDRWEVTLDLTRRAGVALAQASLAPEVAQEQEQLVHYAAEIPEASARVTLPTPEDLDQISEREIAYGYLGYSWKALYFVRRPNKTVDFHQGSSWNNYRYLNGGWRYYDFKVRDNDVYSPDYECSGVWSYVQDYKTYGASDTATAIGGYSRCTGTYAVCTLPFTQSYNCRSEALRTQVWVVGNVRCSWSAGMCDNAEGVGWGGAYCGMRQTCSPRSTC